jgi:hypothetical protein
MHTCDLATPSSTGGTPSSTGFKLQVVSASRELAARYGISWLPPNSTTATSEPPMALARAQIASSPAQLNGSFMVSDDCRALSCGAGMWHTVMVTVITIQD